MRFSTLCSATALAVGFALAGGVAYASPQFTVDETVADSLDGTITANEISFNYTSVITLGTGDTFTETGSVSFSGFLENGTALHGTAGLNDGNYSLTGSFSAGGTYSSVTCTDFTECLSANFSSLTMAISLSGGTLVGSTLIGTATLNPDDISDTTLNLNASGSPVTLSCGGTGNADCGAWDVNTVLGLNTAGDSYFTSPSPFYLDMYASGNNSQASEQGAGSPIYNDQGGGDTLFRVPEPASLILFGSGLLALGLRRRRRNKTEA